ncbi:hypothetical protein F4823DRAFT_566138 [Ustulina deusta]|nr:hypothetical protein F4823DRAFT_566138 [Ustulina deusta]
MAFAGEMEVDELMADDELVTDSDRMSFGFSENEDEDEDTMTLQPKIPFKERADPFISVKDKKFLRIENYFFSLLRTPGLSIDGILEGTFDAHEIALITPQLGPPDIVRWQMRNARRFHENLETRFKGHTNTVAFKLACLYFGLPVEPLRMEMMSFLSPPDPDPLEKEAVPNPNPLGFLDVYSKEDESIHSENILSLRGGGDYTVNEKDNTVTWIPSPRNKKAVIPPAVKVEQAIQEISPEDHQMDGVFWSTAPQPPPNTKKEDDSSAPQIRLYGWQGAVDTALKYREFVSKVDKLVSNWDGTDLSIYVDIFRVSPLKFVETVQGSINHGEFGGAPAGDTVWEVLQKYFGNGDTKKHACFIRLSSDGKENHPDGYQPSSKDKHVIRIENADNQDLAYMKVPSNLHADHKPHQFSVEYMHAMQFFLLPYPPHASVIYQDGLTGDAYQYLDPPRELWEGVIDANGGGSPMKMSFKLKAMNEHETPIIIPGASGLDNGVNRLDLRKGKTETPMVSKSLGDVYEVMKLSLWHVNLRRECNGFEIWRQGTDFKNLREPPARIAFSGNIRSPRSLGNWQDFLNVLPDGGPLGFVVRPVYKAYRLEGDREPVSVQLNELDLQSFKALVHNRIYEFYNPEDPSQVLGLHPSSEGSFQAELTIRHNTTEDEWQWIRRNIVEPELLVSVDDLGNDWIIQEGLSVWGPRYISQSYADNRRIPTATAGASFPLPVGALINKTAPISESGSSRLSLSPVPRSTNIFTEHPPPRVPSGFRSTHTGNPSPFAQRGPNTANQINRGTETDTNQGPLDFLFRNSKNTKAEAERMRALRSRAFTEVSSIFTNPLKPVMPLYGPPLETIIKTGPSMPGVSIAMMTPTEMLRLQKEAHSLRFQLLDRTRVCPYADCDRYFTFADGAGLDRHVREDHNILRCFLCDKNEHLLPYYNTDKIKEHFVTEHLDEILRSYGKQVSPRAEPKPARSKLHMTPDGEVKEEASEGYPEDAFEDDGSEDEEREKPQKNYHYITSSSESSGSRGSSPTPKKRHAFSEPYNGKNVWDHLADLVKRGENPWNKLMAAKQAPADARPPHAEPSFAIPGRPVASDLGQKLYQAKLEAARAARPASSTAAVGEPSPMDPDTDKDDDGDRVVAATEPARPTATKTADGRAEIFTLVNPSPGTWEENGAWIKGVLERYVAAGGKTFFGLNADTPRYKLFTAVNPRPGTSEENDEFIRAQLEEYVREGGKLSSLAWKKNKKEGEAEAEEEADEEKAEEEEEEEKPAASPKASAQAVEDGNKEMKNEEEKNEKNEEKKNEEKKDEEKKDEEKKNEEKGKKKNKGKRKRPADLDAVFDTSASGSDVYEYSERSAVSDPPTNLAPDAPPSPSPSPKRLRKTKPQPPPPTPVTPARSARSVQAAAAVVVTALSSPATSDSE